MGKLHNKCHSLVPPLVFRGDFNLIRRAEDKSSSCINYSLVDKFNNFIVVNKLMEIKRGGPRFTWINKQACPTMVGLNRILVSTDWEANYPLCTAFSLTKVGSDHSPTVLNLGDKEIIKPGRFYFVKNWFY